MGVSKTGPQSVLQLQWGKSQNAALDKHPSQDLGDKKKTDKTPTFRSNPNLVPNRMLRTAYGAWLILSEPPHRTTSDSFRQISYKHTVEMLLFKHLVQWSCRSWASTPDPWASTPSKTWIGLKRHFCYFYQILSDSWYLYILILYSHFIWTHLVYRNG